MMRTFLQNIKDLFWAWMHPVPPAKMGLWYVQAVINKSDGSTKLDSKRGQLWTDRQALLAEYHRRIKDIVRVTPVGDIEPPDECLYRWYDDEEDHAYRYFYICRVKEGDK